MYRGEFIGNRITGMVLGGSKRIPERKLRKFHYKAIDFKIEHGTILSQTMYFFRKIFDVLRIKKVRSNSKSIRFKDSKVLMICEYFIHISRLSLSFPFFHLVHDHPVPVRHLLLKIWKTISIKCKIP